VKILLTGGLGYIGSNVALTLLESGYSVVILDNLSNSDISTLGKLSRIACHDVPFYEGDIRNKKELQSVFEKEKFDAVMHFAGLKSVEESSKYPLKYFDNNVSGTINLLDVMNHHCVKKLIFSSSASVYGKPEKLPLNEDSKVNPLSVYGKTKLAAERIMTELCSSDDEWKIILLRYFNPVGAHKSGMIGEVPQGVPNNLVPFITDVMLGKREHLKVFGNDYHTYDGTGVRDYIHIEDLATGHLSAVNFLKENFTSPEIFNLGTGKGYSVLDVIKSCEKASGSELTYKFVKRRKGDPPECYAQVCKARSILKWEAKRSIDEMCLSAVKFAFKNT
jgi:UDP-glucose 4-epimerase